MFETSEGENVAAVSRSSRLGIRRDARGVRQMVADWGELPVACHERLGRRLARPRPSLQLDYRKIRKHDGACVLDVLVGVEGSYLKSRGHIRVVLVGHSFGGAVVIDPRPVGR